MIYVKDIMTRKVVTVSPDASIAEAARKMARNKIGSVVVIEDGKPVGIVTEGDVSRAVARNIDPNKNKVRKIMSKELITIEQDAKIEEAARLMSSKQIKKLPVIEQGKLIGIVTQTDIVSNTFDLVTVLKEMVAARYRPPDFEP